MFPPRVFQQRLALLMLALLPGFEAQAWDLGDPPAFPAYPPSGSSQGLAPRAAAAAGLAVDTKRREAVRNVYNTLFAASDAVAMGWTGNVGGCVGGATSQAFRNAVALRINVVRALAGVPAAVSLDSAYNAKAQQAALMMSANNQLNHFPPSSWNCYTVSGGEAAGKSNLAIGLAGPQAIIGYIEDSGANNAVVGHRRWLLYPQTQRMGTGDVAGDASHSPTNALWVQDSRIWDVRPATRDGFVAWPQPGFVPYPLAFARWSISYPNADFSAATVGMGRNGVSVPLARESVVNGFGENTLVWRPADALLTNPAPLARADATFTVKVGNVRIGGQTRSFSYNVTLFDPARYGTDTVLPRVVGSTSPASGRDNPYAIAGAVPLADGYDWLSAKAKSYTAVLGAEGGLVGVATAVSPGYAVVTGETAAAGANAYHLMHTQAREQILTVNKLLMPGASGAVNFYSRLGWAGAGEAVAVQVSLDGGISWQDIYAQRGSGDQGEQAFVPRRLSLAKFAGRALKLQFNFKQPTGTYYTSGSGVGWYVDNVAFANTASLEAPAAKPAAGGAFSFNPPAPGPFLLAARGKIKGHPLEWGKLAQVNAQASSPADCLFDWAERNYASLFAPAGPPSLVWSVYTYRYYSATRFYLGVSSADSHVHYLGPDGLLKDAGPLSYWLPLAGCQ